MTGFLLDTNVLSEFARTGKPDPHVDRWLKIAAEESLFASVLTFAEIRRGIELLPVGKRRTHLEQWRDDLVASFATRLFPVTKSVADRWAILSAQTQRKGIALANIDGLIVATALEHDLTLVTRNVKDFAGEIQDLIVQIRASKEPGEHERGHLRPESGYEAVPLRTERESQCADCVQTQFLRKASGGLEFETARNQSGSL